jgi:hypothetical protein
MHGPPASPNIYGPYGVAAYWAGRDHFGILDAKDAPVLYVFDHGFGSQALLPQPVAANCSAPFAKALA